MAAAGTLSPGLSGGTLSAASVNLNAGSDLAYTLGGHQQPARNHRRPDDPGERHHQRHAGQQLGHSGTYVLATYGGTATNNSSAFTGWVVRGTGLGSHIYSFTLGSGSLDMVVAAANAYAGSWTATTGGSWGTSGNWLSGHVPTNLTDTATFGTAIGSGAATITLDANRTLSGLTFSSTGNGNYTITAGTGGILTLDNGGTAVPLSVTSGSDTISAAVDLADNLSFSGSAGTRLTISGSMGEWVPGRTLSVSGSRHVAPDRVRRLHRRDDGQRRHAANRRRRPHGLDQRHRRRDRQRHAGLQSFRHVHLRPGDQRQRRRDHARPRHAGL